MARDAGKLIPLSLDGADPPLGLPATAVNQSDPAGKDIASLRTPMDQARSQRIANQRRRRSSISKSKSRTARGKNSDTTTRAAPIRGRAAVDTWRSFCGSVGPESSRSRSPCCRRRNRRQAMAADYANLAAADMAAFLPRRFDRATVIAPADASGADTGYRMLISTDPHGAGANATLTLSDEDGRTTLWSQNWSVDTRRQPTSRTKSR